MVLASAQPLEEKKDIQTTTDKKTTINSLPCATTLKC